MKIRPAYATAPKVAPISFFSEGGSSLDLIKYDLLTNNVDAPPHAISIIYTIDCCEVFSDIPIPLYARIT